MKRTVGLIAGVIALLLAAAAARAGSRTPLAVRAEEQFFRALNHEPSGRSAALTMLTAAYTTDPSDPRNTLLLGLAQLWSATEGARSDPRRIEHVFLATHYLERAQALAPADGRIPSWLVPMRIAAASIERDASSKVQVESSLWTAYEADPNFHAFTIAMMTFRERRDSERFRKGLDALRAVPKCVADDPSCQNLPRWPHNREGFGVLRADYELKAGNVDRARELLLEVKSVPEYGTFAFASEVEDRLANLESYASMYANDRTDDDPAAITNHATMCQVCHKTR